MVDIAFGCGTGVLLPGLVWFMEGIVDGVVGRVRVLDWAADVDAGLTELPVLGGVAPLWLLLVLGDRLLSSSCFLAVLWKLLGSIGAFFASFGLAPCRFSVLLTMCRT